MTLEGLYEEVLGKLESWANTFAEMLPNVLVAILVVLLFWAVARLAATTSDRALKQLHTHKAARGLISRFIQIGVLLGGIVLALGVMNLDKALASILAGAGIVGLALGFAFQDLAGNLISGIGLAVHQAWPFKIGDIIETNDVFGTVEEIHLRTTIIRTLDDKMVIVPNKQIYQNQLTNYSASGTRRVDVECGISYGDDLEKVKRVVHEALDGLERRDTNKDVQVFFSGYGDSSINFVGRFWVEYVKHTDYLGARSDAVVAIKQAFDSHDIVIPFPIRTLDFGIRGGEPLSEALPALALRDDSRPRPLSEGNGKGSD
jgi:small conductance mechanosensitive channel